MVNSHLNIKERLKNLVVDPLCKTAVTREIMLQIQRNNKFKLLISDEIERMLEEIYKPLGLWGQNLTSNNQDYGVVNEKGEWQYQNYFNTNYSCHEFLFNRCNLFIFNLYKKKGIESINISGETFTYLSPIVIDDETLLNESETLHKIKRLLILIDNYKLQIFSPGSEILERLIELCINSSTRGDETQKFYVDNINDFFDDIVDIRELGGFGNYEDRSTGIDVWTKHSDEKMISHQIKGTCDIVSDNDGYLINSALSQTSRCDLYVFVCEKKQILILRNNKKEMVWGKNGVFFPKKLKYDEKFYNE